MTTTTDPLLPSSSQVEDDPSKNTTQSETDTSESSGTTGKFTVPGSMDAIYCPLIVCVVLNWLLKYIAQSAIGMSSPWISTMEKLAFACFIFCGATSMFLASSVSREPVEKPLIEVGDPHIYELPSIWGGLSTIAFVIACIVYVVDWFQAPSEPVGDSADAPDYYQMTFVLLFGFAGTVITASAIGNTLGFREAVKMMKSTCPTCTAAAQV